VPTICSPYGKPHIEHIAKINVPSAGKKYCAMYFKMSNVLLLIFIAVFLRKYQNQLAVVLYFDNLGVIVTAYIAKPYNIRHFPISA
jgi:hypothetical protein